MFYSACQIGPKCILLISAPGPNTRHCCVAQNSLTLHRWPARALATRSEFLPDLFAVLMALPAPGARCCCRQMLLPPSVGAFLMSQDVPKNGAIFFEVATQDGRRTHAGVLDFTAPEGTVVLPHKVVRSLRGLEQPDVEAAQFSGRVSLTYRRLEKGGLECQALGLRSLNPYTLAPRDRRVLGRRNKPCRIWVQFRCFG
jgi:Ubiquitin fusion degradation protein UFD1